MKKHSGFTLIEMMIVVVIIGILAAIALGTNDEEVPVIRSDGGFEQFVPHDCIERYGAFACRERD